jgi:ABC-type polar amino acid transport system ATPase subunit
LQSARGQTVSAVSAAACVPNRANCGRLGTDFARLGSRGWCIWSHGDKLDAYPAQLSGGQQQRMAIARSPAMKPKVILFYEPTSTLDPEPVGDVLKVMQQVAEEGMMMAVVTHEMGFANEVADRMLFLDKGRILEQGPPTEIRKNPKNERTRDFPRRVIHAM